MFLAINWAVDSEIIDGYRTPNLYGLLFVTGLVLGYFVVKRMFKQEGIKEDVLDKLVAYMVIATIVGARLGHVLFYGPYYDSIDNCGSIQQGYFEHPITIFYIWEGGLASHGGAIAILISFYALVLSGPLQAYVDIAFTILGIGIYLLRRYIPRKSWNLNVRTYLGVLAAVIWAEFIFLVPFFGSWIPVLGNDIQVKIRANFWLAGMRQFFSSPLLGVGPDQYGNHYEASRTLSDAKAYERILSNDAHASAVQTLATLGILGTLALLFFLALLIRSLLIQWDRNPGQRKHLFALGLYFFVYLTNSFISPMAIPAKYLFWALGGWVIGQTYLKQSLRLRSIKIPVAILTATSVLILANFSVAQWRYSTAFEKYAVNQKASSDYKFNPFIPCFMYFEGKFHILENEKLDEIQTLAREQLDANPRCVSARIILAQIYQGTGDMDALEYQVSQLLEIAPYRTEVLRMGIEYANKAGDADLFNELQRRFSELGLVYVPGKDG